MPYTSIREAANELSAGVVTATEMVIQSLAAIDERDPDIHAFVQVMRDDALKAADQADKELHVGLYRGPLHGVPIAVKDLIAVKGVPTRANSRVLSDAPNEVEDAMVVEQLRRAGAIIIGKTCTYEFAYGPYAPPARNPWNHERTTGGSSGGSAASVSAGMCLGAIGTDTGGSIRIPSACCGITGLKPTFGRVSCYGVIPLSASLDHVGPMGHSAEDCALIFDAIARYDPRDVHSVSGPPATLTTNLIRGVEGHGPLSLQGIRLGVPQDAFVDPLDPEVRNSWRAALHVMQEGGAEVIQVDLPPVSFDLYRTIQKPEATLAHKQRGWYPERLSLYSPLVQERLHEGEAIQAVQYLRALHEQRTFSGSLRSLLQRVDAFVLPTIPLPAILADHEGEDVVIDGVSQGGAAAYLRLTMPFNLSGLPAISFPCGFNHEALPIGLQVVGRPFEEALILRVAHTYQQLTDWHRRESSV